MENREDSRSFGQNPSYTEKAFKEWKYQRSIETSQFQYENNDKVPIKLSERIQVWIPIELTVVVQSLWNENGTEENIGTPSEGQIHDIRVWSTFLKTVQNIVPVNETILSFNNVTITQASKHYLLKLGYWKLIQSLDGNDIHSVTRGLSSQIDIIKTYYTVMKELENFQIKDNIQEPLLLKSLKEKDNKLFGVFGGQGPSWFSELKELYETYPILAPLIERVSKVVLEQSKHSDASPFYSPYGFDLLNWLHSSDQMSPSFPDESYMSSAPISCPMIALTQLCHYYITLHTWNIPPSEANKIFAGFSGHSQGILSAVIAASSTTFEDLLENIINSVKLMMWFGIRLQHCVPFSLDVRSEILQESKQLGYGKPTPMLAVVHLLDQDILKYIEIINKSLKGSKERYIELALRNGPRACVVVGHPESLHSFVLLLHRAEMPIKEKQSQNRIAYSKRKKEFYVRYLKVSVPFHWNGLSCALKQIMEDVDRIKFKKISGKDLSIPIYSTEEDGKVLNQEGDDLIEKVLSLQSFKHVFWASAIKDVKIENKISHLIDFGHGGSLGIGITCARLLEGTGVQTILAGSFYSTESPLCLDKSELYDTKELRTSSPNWSIEYSPRLVRRKSDGKIFLDTKFTKALGKPPVMVAGMTPTTVDHEIVSSILNAGYHGELAGGGLPTEKMFKETIDLVVDSTQKGLGLTINMLFLNPSLWNRQYPMVIKLLESGYPIDGITCAAGTPSLDKANEIISTLKPLGLLHISFKPGTQEAILDVVNIAKENPDMNIILQWTGGRGGGHHSFEDFHEPILRTYSIIRSVSNIILVGGSGFGDHVDTWPYMNGSWSQKYGYPPMPFDAILIASRVMVAKEAKTSLEAKELLVNTPGIEREELWEKSYDDIAGGVVTVSSELGEPIHNVATKGVLLWKQFDKELFSLPKDKMIQKIEEKKDWIIESLNSSFQKVYFGRKFDGTVCDLEDMTYSEVCYRIVELMYIYSKESKGTTGKWIHPDFMELLFDFLCRVEERFSTENDSKLSYLPPKANLLENPHNYLNIVFEQFYTEASNQLLCSEDIDFFIEICRKKGRKPVNFVPVIDENLSFWFKKDSLWQSENLEAVEDNDVQRVVILQGPLAVRYSNKVNEPVSEILDGIHDGWIKELLASKYNNSIENVPFVENLIPLINNSIHVKENNNINVNIEENSEENTKSISIHLPHDNLPDQDTWINFLSEQVDESWWKAILNAPYIVQNDRRVENIFRNILQPRKNQIIKITSKDSAIDVSIIENGLLPNLSHDHPIAQIEKNQNQVSLILYHVKPVNDKVNIPIPLKFLYEYHPTLGFSCVHEVSENRINRIKEFYSKLWFEGLDKKEITGMQSENPIDLKFRHSFAVKKADIERFYQSVNRQIEPTQVLSAPLDFSIVIGWESIIKTLFVDAVDGDLLQLVHLSNGFKRLNNSTGRLFFYENDVVDVIVEITELLNVSNGQKVTIKGVLSVNGEDPIVEINSQFFFRGNSTLLNTFRKYSMTKAISIHKKDLLEIIKTKKWIQWEEGETINLNDVLIFTVNTTEKIHESGLKSIRTEGSILKQAPHAHVCNYPNGDIIAKISYENENVHGCIVKGFLSRFGSSLEKVNYFQNGGYQIMPTDHYRSPNENNTYSIASGDFNPIHTNPYFSIVAKLPTTITHGMWTSANAYRVIETFASKGKPERILSFSTEFVGMVNPQDNLQSRVKHVGMKDGKLLLEITTKNQNNITVLKGSAEIKAPNTAYVFTGQGSSEVGMGMDLYQESEVARNIWNAADTYFLSNYGFSILQIVKENPKEITIHFGGELGKRIRNNYKRLIQQVQVKEGDTFITKEMPLFPDITDSSPSHTFRHPEGLLFATQFSQPSLVLVELAAFSDMKLKGLIPDNCKFAGHSLGEYAALASVASILTTESLVDIVFLRGMTMQNAVIRDEKGRSRYAMVAVNPGRVHPHKFRDKQLDIVIEQIINQRNELLQVVNYNVENYQYVVAGERGNLFIMSEVLNELYKDISKFDQLEKIIKESIQKVEAHIKTTGDDYIPLNRGQATIPLPGIDVPFHSKFLKDGVPPFRYILQQRMDCRKLNIDLLVGRYIPNVIAKEFSLSKEYIETVYNATGSAILKELLENYEEELKDKQVMAFKLLVELLAYQFASPVRWIETQHLFFTKLNIERMIEVGPAPTLFTMAKRTLSTGQYSPLISRDILWYGRDKNAIYYLEEDIHEEVEEVVEESKPAPPKPSVVSQPIQQPVQQVQQVQQAPPSQVPDSPVTPFEFLQTIISLRMKKPLSEIKETDSIKNLVGGKSALQNELLGDIENEFATKMPEGASESTLQVLSQQMGQNYKQLGKVGNNLIHKFVSTKMPGGFGMNQIKQYLTSSYGLGEGRIQGVLLHAAAKEPQSRFTQEAEAKSYLDSIVQSYAANVNIQLSSPSTNIVQPSMPVSVAPQQNVVVNIPDEPVKPILVLRVLLALKLKKPLDQILPSMTIKDLVGGKSALQNELVGDIGKEFGQEPENAAEMDLSTMASTFKNYQNLGQVSNALINKLYSTKMPGGFGVSSVRSYLSQRYGLGDGRTNSFLIYSVAFEPSSRMTSEEEAKSWIDSTFSNYCASESISLPTSGPVGNTSVGASVVDSQALKAFRAKYDALVKKHLEAYADYLEQDPLASEKVIQMNNQLRFEAEKALELWILEHGDVYSDGIKPVFDSKKERRYDSSWNWVRQDCLQLYYDYACGRATQWTVDIRERLYHIKNRATPKVVDMVEYYMKKAVADGHAEIVQFIQILADTLRIVMDDPPKYRELKPPTKPYLSIEADGSVKYQEVSREISKDMNAYVNEMRNGPTKGKIFEEISKMTSSKEKVLDIATKFEELLRNNSGKDDEDMSNKLNELSKELLRIKEERKNKNKMPYLFIKKRNAIDPSTHEIDENLTSKYFDVLSQMANEGVSLTGKVVLVTGCGKGSIGLEILKAMLRAGAKVYATTSRFSSEGSGFYHTIFDHNGSKFSNLIVLPFNQASVQDVQALVDYIYDKEKCDIDYIIPFAAISVTGRDISEIDSKSELSLRILLTNVLRLIGAVKSKKEQLRIVTRPAHVLLPLSPNHGIFGFDGLYAESKLGLEALLNKWKSEGWSKYLSIAGAIIGWTRGTGLMSQNNIVASGIESLGARTFSSEEMCFNLMGLLHPDMVAMAQNEPVLADLNGGLHLISNLNEIVTDLRASIVEKAAIAKAINQDTIMDLEIESGIQDEDMNKSRTITPRANLNIKFPSLPSEKKLASLSYLKGMLDLENVVVITGFGEVGPFGSARTRWELESYGEFSLEGCIELAWIMGLIKYQKDPSTGTSSWVDAKTGEKINDFEIKSRYEEILLNHTGIRIIEPELFDGYDPNKKMILHQVALNQTMTPIEVSKEEAEQLKRQHGENVDIYESDGTWYAQLKKNAVLYIPKALKFDRFVAGQVPSNWDPSIYGIPKDISNQVDRVTLFTLVSTVESLVSAGITDPYEFYEYVHVSELGNTIGGGFGGMNSIRSTYRLRLLDEPVQGDILQETFVNTVAAWVNMLLLSSSGPIKTPVGACATAVESIDIGYDTIKTGKAKICIVGGYDDFGEEGSYEFANMKATANSEEEIKCGRTPKEMSRPTTSTRSGFVESHGAGTQIMMTADLAIKMGVPIYAIVEHVATATDKVGRSVPAPGQGILTTAREVKGKNPSPLLNLDYRRKNLKFELDLIEQWKESELKIAKEECKDKEEYKERENFILSEINRRKKVAYSTWSHDFYRNNPHIAPIRGALAVYGLTVDDIGVASYHGTSTKGNDINESEVIQKQLEHLGRSKGNVILSIHQKYLTGHPKGAAAAWMVNGLIQSMLSGIVPGNRNADNIDPEIRKYDQIVFLNRSLHTYGFKAGLLKSFGFGQVGGEVLLIHPDYVLSSLDENQLRVYSEKRMKRQQLAYRHFQDSITNKVSYIPIKETPPYSKEEESKVYLNPLARASYDPKLKTWSFNPKKTVIQLNESPSKSLNKESKFKSFTFKKSDEKSSIKKNISSTTLTHMEVMMREMGEGLRTTIDRGIGVDAQLISEIEVCISNTDFVTRNFTNDEIAYCRSAPDPSSSFSGRWAAKEAVIKAISSCDSENLYSKNLWKGSGESLKDIEIVPSSSGAPKVVLRGYALEVATLLGISVIKVAISHSGEYAIAQAIAR